MILCSHSKSRMVSSSWETLLLSSGLHVFLLSQRLHNVLNGDVSVVYSVCECNMLMSTLACMTYEYLFA